MISSELARSSAPRSDGGAQDCVARLCAAAGEESAHGVGDARKHLVRSVRCEGDEEAAEQRARRAGLRGEEAWPQLVRLGEPCRQRRRRADEIARRLPEGARTEGEGRVEEGRRQRLAAKERRAVKELEEGDADVGEGRRGIFRRAERSGQVGHGISGSAVEGGGEERRRRLLGPKFLDGRRQGLQRADGAVRSEGEGVGEVVGGEAGEDRVEELRQPRQEGGGTARAHREDEKVAQGAKGGGRAGGRGGEWL